MSNQFKLTLKFRSGATVSRGKSEFASKKELVQYIRAAFGLPGSEEVLQMAIRRHGKYQRVDMNGAPIFTFSSPVLDLISDSEGKVKVGGVVYDLKATHDAGLQGSRVGSLSNALVNGFDNPSEFEFEENGFRLRMAAWRTDYGFFWHMGAKIESFGVNFAAARIDSQYGEPILDGGVVGAVTCAIIKSDGDEAVQTDLVDESEWGIGAPQPASVRSACIALWQGQTIERLVQAGSGCQVWLGEAPVSRGLPSGSPWHQVSGRLRHVSVAADGSVWGVNSDDDIFRRDIVANRWEKIRGALKQISVGNHDHVWGVSSDNEIYQWSGEAWRRVLGQLKHVSVASDGSVWGVNSDDKIFRRNHVLAEWEVIRGELKQVSVGGHDVVWGVNSDDKIYQWHGTGWRQVSGQLKYISVSADGSVWGVNSDDEIFRRDAVLDRWEQIKGSLRQISVGHHHGIWGVNSDDDIYELL